MAPISKPNQISSTGGELQASSPWDAPASVSSPTPSMDPYSPEMMGAAVAGSADHNSQTLNPTPTS